MFAMIIPPWSAVSEPMMTKGYSSGSSSAKKNGQDKRAPCGLGASAEPDDLKELDGGIFERRYHRLVVFAGRDV